MQQQINGQLEGLITFERCHSEDLRSLNVESDFYFDERVVIGAGTYGKVFKVLSRQDGKFYALKEIKPIQPKHGVYQILYYYSKFPITALREIKFLQNLQCQNIIHVHNVCSRTKTKRNIIKVKAYCVMDFMDFDIHNVLRKNKLNSITFSVAQIRSILFQTLKGLEYLHENRIIHRDIKSSNILVNREGQVKIADFGLAKFIPIASMQPKTPNVVTLTYRAPEVLFTRGNYDFKIDVWSVGCLAVELLQNRTCFDARNEADYVKQIFQLCGTPDSNSWPEILKQDQFLQLNPEMNYQRQIFSTIRQKCPNADDDLIDLVNKTLVLNPVQRIDVKQALKHDFFKQAISLDEVSELKKYFETISDLKYETQNKNILKKKEVKQDIDDAILKPMKKIKL